MDKRPNILFVFSDQHRGDWLPYDDETRRKLGVEDLHLETPVLRGMMDRGTAFTCAISPSPVCAPARACLASGMRYKNCRVASNKVNYDPALKTFYAKLKEAGYYVGGCGKFDLNKADLVWDDAFLQSLGFTHTEDSEGKMDTIWAAIQQKPGPYGEMLADKGWLAAHKEDMLSRGGTDVTTPLPDELYADNWIIAKGLRMLEEAPKDQPWFLQVNFSGPHDPWDITKSMKEKMKDRVFPDAADCTITEINQGVRQNYAAMIENIDEGIGRMIDVIEKRGETGNTLVIYASDHGEMMGDHNMYGKSKPEFGSVHIPIVIDASHLGGKAGILNETPVELQDLAATFLDYAGLPHDGMESCSLRPIAEGTAERVRKYAVSELAVPRPKTLDREFATVTDGEFKLIMEPGKADRLYRISEDPFEMKDVAESMPEKVEELKKGYGERVVSRSPEMIAALQAYAKSFQAA